MSEQNLESCLKLRNSQNPFCHIMETLSKNYEIFFWMICSFSSDLQCVKVYNSHSSKNASSWPPLGKISWKFWKSSKLTIFLNPFSKDKSVGL